MSFHINEVFPGIFHIEDPAGVHVTLAAGEKHALLVDTGSGLGDLRGVVESLTPLPLTVVNTHGHEDHFGGNYQFDQILMHEADWALARAHAAERIKREVLALSGTDPESFDLHSYLSYEPDGLLPLRDGAVFELGGETVEAVLMANHTAGSVAFLCRERRLLLAGDAAAPLMYLFFPESSSLERHIQRLTDLLEDESFDRMLCSHSGTVFDRTDLRFFLECARTARNTGRGRRFHDPIFPEYTGLKYTHVSSAEPERCAAIVYDPGRTGDETQGGGGYHQ